MLFHNVAFQACFDFWAAYPSNAPKKFAPATIEDGCQMLLIGAFNEPQHVLMHIIQQILDGCDLPFRAKGFSGALGSH